jgi:hypothetical protein
MELRSCTNTHIKDCDLAVRGLENSMWYFIYYPKMSLIRLTSYLTTECWDYKMLGPF